MRKSFAAAAAFIGILSSSACNKQAETTIAEQPPITTIMYVDQATACLRDGHELVMDVLQETIYKGKPEIAMDEILFLAEQYKDDVEDALRRELKRKTLNDLAKKGGVTDLRPAMKGRFNNFASKIHNISNVEIIEIKHMEITGVDINENGCDLENMPQPSQTSL
jgi:flagellar basal body-associated protein FliL